jgi:hypothetical protein
MSYTQFVSTATCTVVDGFNLQSYLDAISTRCVKEQNFIFDFYGLDSNDELDIDFGDYVRQLDDKVFIECDTEEINSNSEVWDWLIDQFLPIMTSSFVEIKSATVDSRDGVDVDVSYLGKDGKYINTTDLIQNYISGVPVVEVAHSTGTAT